MRKPTPRTSLGFTLLELLVYSLLLGFVMFCIYGILVSAIRYFRTEQAAIELQGAALAAVSNMSADLIDTDADTIAITNGTTDTLVSSGTAGKAIKFASPRTASGGFTQDGSGNLMWQKWVCYYVDSSNWLHCSEIYFGTGYTPTAATSTAPANTSAPTLVQFQASSNHRIIARNVSSSNGIQYTLTNTTTVSINAWFEQSVFSNASGTNDNKCQIQDQVRTRNN